MFYVVEFMQIFKEAISKCFRFKKSPPQYFLILKRFSTNYLPQTIRPIQQNKIAIHV
jgi:hypothetical protein